MAARIILNADDFGLTRGVNRAVAELHRAGVLTSATLMAQGPAFDDAVSIAHELPSLGVGCHIVLVDGTPVLSPGEIPTLLGPDRRRFRPSLIHFGRDLYRGRINAEEMALEAAAQIGKVEAAGIAITHVDTHKHTHAFPQVSRALLSLSCLPAIRKPFEPAFSRNLSQTSLTRRLQVALLNAFRSTFDCLTKETPTTDGTLGIAATGTLTEKTLTQILSRLPAEGTYELCCHPGYHDAELECIATRLRASREAERQALLFAIPQIFSHPQSPTLIHYGNLES